MLKAEYLDHMGTDLSVVDAARVSFDKTSEWEEICQCGQSQPTLGWPCSHGGCSFERRLKPSDERLINYLARFYSQRTDPHAQQEVRDLAIKIGALIEPLFPVSWKALTDAA